MQYLKTFKEVWWWIVSALILPVFGFGFNMFIEFHDLKQEVEELQEIVDSIPSKEARVQEQINELENELIELRAQVRYNRRRHHSNGNGE